MAERKDESGREYRGQLRVNSSVASALLAAFLICFTQGLIGNAFAQSAREDVRAAQQALQKLGLVPGPADGRFGQRTSSAVAQFQRRNGLDPTGQLDTATLQALGIGVSGTASSSGTTDEQTARAPAPALDSPADPSANNSNFSGGAVIGFIVLLGIVWLVYRGWRSGRTASTAPSSAPPLSMPGQTAGKPFIHVSVSSYGDLYRSSFSGRPSATKLKAEGDECWVQKARSVTIAGYSVTDGMVYVGKNLTRQDGYGRENCLIDPDLPVATEPSNAERIQISYYPSYSTLDPASRRAYLQWLTGGKGEPGAYIGYVFLYFYGLERRLLLDSAVDEREALIAEVERLRSIYAHNGSFDGYSRQLLDAVGLVQPHGKFYGALPPLERRGWEVPLVDVVKLAIGQLVAEDKPISASWMLAWTITDPNTHLRTPASRAPEEFHQLFCERFATKFPDGFKMDAPKRRLNYNYRAASATFRVDLSSAIGDLPDITSLSAPLTKMRKLAEECIEVLDPYSRFLGRHPKARGSFRALTLLPRELAERVEGDEVHKLRSMFDRLLADGPKLFGAKEMLTHVTGAPVVQAGRVMLQSCADALAYFGVGLAPDPRTALQLPKADQPVVVFKLPKQRAEAARDNEAFRHALLFLTFAGYVAHSDGTVTPAEREWMTNFVRTASQLDDAARIELDANLQWLLAVPPELGPLRSRLASLSTEERHQIGRTALAVACTTGTINPTEIKSLQRIYKVLSLDEAQVLHDVHAFIAEASPANEPVSIRLALPTAKGYAIPKRAPTNTVTGVRLDTERIKQISENTKRVNAILAKVFQTDESDGIKEDERLQPTMPASDALDTRESDPFDGLEPRHRRFLAELITRREWPRQDLDTLARSFSLMTDGAIEAINEWAFERYGDALIEDGDPMTVNGTLLAQVNQAAHA